MAQLRCTFIGLDSYNSHAFGAINNYLEDRNTVLHRQQIILVGYWGNLNKLTWLPSSKTPIKIIDATEINHNRLARVYELPIGEFDDLGHSKVVLLQNREHPEG